MSLMSDTLSRQVCEVKRHLRIFDGVQLAWAAKDVGRTGHTVGGRGSRTAQTHILHLAPTGFAHLTWAPTPAAMAPAMIVASSPLPPTRAGEGQDGGKTAPCGGPSRSRAGGASAINQNVRPNCTYTVPAFRSLVST